MKKHNEGGKVQGVNKLIVAFHILFVFMPPYCFQHPLIHFLLICKSIQHVKPPIQVLPPYKFFPRKRFSVKNILILPPYNTMCTYHSTENAYFYFLHILLLLSLLKILFLCMNWNCKHCILYVRRQVIQCQLIFI